MKLYTKEQIQLAMRLSHSTDLTYLEIIDTLEAIELPTDEEIEKIAIKLEHYEGAMWLKYMIIKQIQGGNK